MPERMNVRNTYLEQMVESASPDKLLMMLVDGAVNFIRRAEMSIEGGKLDEAHNFFVKAQNIYLELTITLDLDAGDFSEKLGLVYQFLYNLLIEANLEKDLNKTRKALKLAEQIRDLWKDTIELAKSETRSEASDHAKQLMQDIQGTKLPKTGVYSPVGTAKIVEEKIQSDGTRPNLNITG